MGIWIEAQRVLLDVSDVFGGELRGTEGGRTPQALPSQPYDFRTMMETIDYENRVDPFLEWLGELPLGQATPDRLHVVLFVQ